MYLIHVIGDIHQPLHACSLVNDRFPNNDQGGNLMKIIYLNNKNITNLHSLWDSVLDADYNNINHPMTEKTTQKIKDEASSLIDEFPKSDLKELNNNIHLMDWIEESWNLCKSNVYKNMFLNKIIKKNDDYILSNFTPIKKQLALAGYRLSDLLVSIYKSYKNHKSSNMNTTNLRNN